MDPALVCLGYYLKIPGWVLSIKTYFFSSEDWKPKIRIPEWLGEGLLPGHGFISVASQDGRQGIFLAPF